MSDRQKKLIVIVGPTAVGKTEAAIRVAEEWNTEIISADSRQVFRELEIGTAKPSPEQLARVPHHFIGNVSIHESYDAAKYGEEALLRIQQLFEKHDRLILCGGSGLYLKAVLEGFDEMPDIPEQVRLDLIRQYEENGIQWLQEKLREKDPAYFEIVDQKNPQRMMRALEIVEGTGLKVSDLRKKKKRELPFEIIQTGLELDRTALYERIDQRMDQMLANGLMEEAKAMYSWRHLNALQTVGYQEIFDFMDGQFDYEEMVRLLKRNSRHYAKRQLTWFKKDPETRWIHPDQWHEMLNLA